MVNLTDKVQSASFLKNLATEKKKQKRPIFTAEQLEIVIGIVESQNTYFIDRFDASDNSYFSIFNINDRTSIDTHEPALKIPDSGIGLVYVNKFHNVTMSPQNLLKTDIVGYKTRSKYFTEGGMPKYSRGLHLMDMSQLL